MNDRLTKAARAYLDAAETWQQDRRQTFEGLIKPMERAHGPCPVPVRKALWSAYNVAWTIGHPTRLYPPPGRAARRMYRNWRKRKIKSGRRET